MFHFPLLDVAAPREIIDATAAGTTDINSDTVDMSSAGAVGCLAIVKFGAITANAVTSVKLQGSTDNSTWTDIDGAKVTVAHTDDNKIAALDILRPVYRYIRVQVDRATANAVIEAGVAILYGSKAAKPSKHSTAAGYWSGSGGE